MEDGELTGTDKVFKILSKLNEKDSINESLLKPWEKTLLNKIRNLCQVGFCDNKLGSNHVLRPGFDKPPGGEINSKNHVLNDHSYCC